MTIGSHGCTHPDYKIISYNAGLSDAFNSKILIENMLDLPISAFAFPWGHYQNNQPEELKKLYKFIFTTEHGFNSINDSVFCRNEVANAYHLRSSASGSLDYFKRNR
jgi:peptidoglycan/xylan/chitin deacetylase (PgdA/CDA1 family)